MGSNPVGGFLIFWFRLNFRSVLCGRITSAFVAQLAARGSHNPKVAGSIPVESNFSPH